MDIALNNTNSCEVKGHNNKQLIPILCMSSNCDSSSRYLCQQCLIDGIHYHNGLKPQILSQEQILAQFQQRLTLHKQSHQEKLKSFEQQYQVALKIITEIENIIKNLQPFQFQEGFELGDSDQNYFESLRMLITQSFFQLSADNISQIINISAYQLDSSKIEQFIKNFDNLISKFESLKVQVNSFLIYDHFYSSQINIDEEIRKTIYTEKLQINDLIQEKLSISKSKISFNNQYIALVRSKYEPFNKTNEWGISCYNYYKYYFDLINLETKKALKLRFKNSQIDFLQFSNDSQLLYYKEKNEYFCCFHLKEENYQEFRYFPELLSIQFILTTIWNRAFVINKNNKLQLLDMEYQYKIFEQQTKNANQLVFDNINSIIISAGDVLEFWDENGIKLHEGSQDQKLQQLQMKITKGESTLLGCEQQYLLILLIQYNQNLLQVIELQKFNNEQNILSYSLAFNKQYCIIFGEYGSIKVYDKDFNTIKHMQIGSEEDQTNKQFDIAQCSKNLSSITVISYKNSKCLYLTPQK